MRHALVIVPYEKYGGMSRFATYQRKEWWENGRSPPLKIINTYGPGQIYYMPFYFFAGVFYALFLMACGRVSVVHVHMAEGLSVFRKFIFLRMALFFGIPSIIHLHSAEFESFYRRKGLIGKYFIKHTFDLSTFNVALGSRWAKFLVDELGVAETKIRVIHNGVPDGQVADKRGHADSRAIQICFLGALNERKGVHELIEALSGLPNTQGWTCKIAGNGDLNYWNNLSRYYGVDDKVDFVGWLDEAQSRQLMKESDIFVLPSHNEGLPLALLEAMSCCICIVTTNVGDIGDAIRADIDGIVIPPKRPELLLKALMKVLSDQNLRDALAANARLRYEEKFTLEAMNGKIQDMYLSLQQ